MFWHQGYSWVYVFLHSILQVHCHVIFLKNQVILLFYYQVYCVISQVLNSFQFRIKKFSTSIFLYLHSDVMPPKNHHIQQRKFKLKALLLLSHDLQQYFAISLIVLRKAQYLQYEPFSNALFSHDFLLTIKNEDLQYFSLNLYLLI